VTLPGYAEHAPVPALRSHVACYWTLASADLRAHRVLPDGCMDVLFDLAAATGEVIGVMTRADVVPACQRVDLLGVRFRPGEAAAFLGFSARNARDRAVPLPEIWGRVGSDVAARLAETADPASRLRLLDAWLLERKLRARFAEPRVRAAIRVLEATRGAATVRDLAARAGVGERQLERAFDERVGVGPKALARAIRLQAFVAALDRRAGAPLAAVAAESGFADEPHLIREVKALAGVTPRELYRERMSDSFKSTGQAQAKLVG
jgi:methylphosphotriester-DNA--protein-cysteine methyltransferase